MPASPPSPHSRKLSRPITTGWGSKFNSFAGKGVCKTLLTYRVKKNLTDYKSIAFTVEFLMQLDQKGGKKKKRKNTTCHEKSDFKVDFPCLVIYKID